MAANVVSIIRPPIRKKAIRKENLSFLTVPDQVRIAFQPGARIAAIAGAILGGYPPLASWQMVHYEVAAQPWKWWLVAGALLYSGMSVFWWGMKAFNTGRFTAVKAIGFVVITEGATTLADTKWLSLMGLGILIGVNAICTAVSLQAIDRRVLTSPKK